jgi:CotH kinase protein
MRHWRHGTGGLGGRARLGGAVLLEAVLLEAVLFEVFACLAVLGCSSGDTTHVTPEERAVLPAEPAPETPALPPEPANPEPSTPPVAEPPVAEPAPVAGPVGPPESIFEREHLIEVRVEIGAEDWERLSFEGIGMREILFPANGFREVPPYTRFTGSVTVDGVRYDNVSIRKKGYIGSLSVIRPSLKLDFSRNFELPLAGGMRRMTLNNDLQDQTHVRQCLSYDLFNEIGVPASRCNYAHVVVNGVDLGTYSHVEDVTKSMLARHFENNDGNLYEGQLSDFTPATAAHLEMETNDETNDASDVQALIAALATSDDQLVATLGRVVDLDEFFDFWAMETLLGHWDGYASNANNYFAYHDPTSDKFFFIPWGTDQAFVGDNPNDALPYDVTTYAAGAIANRLYALPEQRTRYRTRLGVLNDELWQVPSLLERVDELSRLAPNVSRPELARLQSYIRGHGETLRAALQLPSQDWPVAPPPAPPIDNCVGSAGTLSGTFSTRWGAIDDLADLAADESSQFETSIEIDGALFPGRFHGRAGEDTPNIATLRMLAPRDDGWYVLVELNMPLELFVPGYHPFHSFESVGDFGISQPTFDRFFDGPFRFGRIGDGAVQLDEASLQPGGIVSGRFDGIIDYYLCVSTYVSFFPSPAVLNQPPVAPPAEEPPAEEPPAGEPAAGEPPPEPVPPEEPVTEQPR